MSLPDRRMVFYYINDPDSDWEDGYGEELATNYIMYRHFMENKMLDSSKGTHVLIINGNIDHYGNDLSPEEYEKLAKEHPGMCYAPVIEEEPILMRRFSFNKVID